jgi:hypothetical protein
MNVVAIIMTTHGISKNSVGMDEVSGFDRWRAPRPGTCHGAEMWPLCNAPENERFFREIWSR